MDPITALTLADGFLTLIEKLVPAIQDGVKKGQIPVEKQKEIQARADAVRAGFEGPEWKVD